MPDKSPPDRSAGQVNGPQTNIDGDGQGPSFSGQFEGPVATDGDAIDLRGSTGAIIKPTFVQSPASPRIPLQKPLRVPHFTGREKELEGLLRDLQPGHVITICGPGGMGKTALAAEAIWQLAPGNDPPQRFPDGIFFHTFYHKPQAALALESIARAYGEDPRQSPLEAAKRALSGRKALIVLDGTEACDDLEAVLGITASCGVLITTRRHSDAPADFSDLLPLPLDKAVQLLQAWGGEMASEVKICESLCNLLGRLPLAVFLVGRYMAHRRQLAGEYLAWLEKTPLVALDLGERQHQSIPLLMEHSLLQVSDQAQGCLGLTGVLALKPFESDIIAIALEISNEDANHSLGELVDFGLLTRPDVRYQITHALAHTYARAKLSPPGYALARLAKYYDDFIRKQTQLGLAGYALLDGQRDHILAVQSACNKAGLWFEVRQLTWALDSYLDLQGHWIERRKSAEAGLNAANASDRKIDVRKCLSLLGHTYWNTGDARKAIEYYEQALTIAREIGDRRGEGAPLASLGLAFATLKDTHKAVEYYERALAIAREVGERRGEGVDLGNLGLAHADLGDTRKAIEYYDQALEIAREIGNKRDEGIHLGSLGLAYVVLGETRKAIEYYKQALAIAQEIGDKRNKGNWLGNLGIAYKNLGETHKSIEYYEQALAIAREIGDKRGEAIACWNLGLFSEKRGDLKRAVDLMQACIKLERDIGHPDAEKDIRYIENIRARLEKK